MAGAEVATHTVRDKDAEISFENLDEAIFEVSARSMYRLAFSISTYTKHKL